jgi:hypothetical protein
VLYSAEAPRRHLVAIAFLFVLAFPPKLPNKLSQVRLSYLLLLSSHSLVSASCSISDSWCSQNILM